MTSFRLSLPSGIMTVMLLSVCPAAAQTPVPAPTPTPAPVPIETPDFPGAVWAPAAPGNFRRADRPTSRAVDRVIIHDIEGGALSAVNWFQNPKAGVSSHYVISGETGQVWQMVKERDVAYHAGNADTNGRSVGIEHQGFAYRPGFYDTTLYEASARLVRQITDRYQIPRDRTHIIGHFEVPDPVDPTRFGGRSHHTDPGPYWDWDSFMALVRNDARVDSFPLLPAVLHPGEKVTVTLGAVNLGDDPWPVVVSPDERGDSGRIALTRREPVYLGVWPPPPVLSAPVALHSNTWTSPRLVGLPAGAADIAPGGSARFSFVLQGPPSADRATVSQQLRLMRVSTAPRPMVGFGPVVSIATQVRPWEVKTKARLAAGSGWQQNRSVFWTKISPGSAATPAPATWNAALPISGAWDVYMRWPGAKGRTAKAMYEVVGTDGTQRVTVDQRQQSGGWRKLGRVAFGTSAVVRLTGAAPGVVVADTVRFVGPFAAPK